jgi:hypothetical protein
MIDGHDEHGHFTKGNRASRGRPKGALNKKRVPPFLEEDQRSAPARRFRALVERMTNDMGGVQNLSAGEEQLIQRAAMISVTCEQMEQKAANGEPFDLTVYATATGHLGRTLKLLGLKRQPRDETPSLRDYLNAARQPGGAFAIEEEGETAGNA